MQRRRFLMTGFMGISVLILLCFSTGPAGAQSEKSLVDRVAKLEQKMSTLEPLAASLQASLATLESTVAGLARQLTAAENRISVLEANQGGATAPIIWSGGPSQHGLGVGFVRFRTDQEDFNTAAENLSVNENGLITVLKPGFYRISFHAISEIWNDYQIVQIRKNGQSIHQSYEWAGSQRGWTDIFAAATFPFNAGDTIEVYVYAPNSLSYAYHFWSALDTVSRLQIQYVGGPALDN